METDQEITWMSKLGRKEFQSQSMITMLKEVKVIMFIIREKTGNLNREIIINNLLGNIRGQFLDLGTGKSFQTVHKKQKP